MKIIMVIGLPGTGKSTFAHALAVAIGGRHLNTDIIRDALGKRGQYDSETKAGIYAEMLRQTSIALSRGENVVIDGTFYQQKLRLPYIAIAKKYEVPIYWMEIGADEQIIRSRVNQRRIFSEADFEVYLKIKSEYEHLDAPHLDLRSDLLGIPEMVEKARTYLENGKVE
jgi:predicted kinase